MGIGAPSLYAAFGDKRLATLRASTLHLLQGRIAAARRDGRVPASTDPLELALFYASMLQGMSAQARDGATRADLESIARTAMRVWPRG